MYPHLSADEFLAYLAALKGLSPRQAQARIDMLLELVHLRDVRKRPLGEYSGGMKQRVGIAQALLNDPQILIVDEPTTGLDPEERVRFRNVLSDLAGERIVILSTHIVSDVEAVATEIALIKDGRIIQHDLPENMLKAVEGEVWEVILSSFALPEFRKRFLVGSTSRRSDGVHARVIASSRPCETAVPVEPTLEDAYLSLISNGTGETQI